MANGSSERNTLAVVVTVLGLLVTVVGSAISFQARIMDDVRSALGTELKHTVTREELAEQRRQEEGFEVKWRLDVLKRLYAIEYEIKQIRRRR